LRRFVKQAATSTQKSSTKGDEQVLPEPKKLADALLQVLWSYFRKYSLGITRKIVFTSLTRRRTKSKTNLLIDYSIEQGKSIILTFNNSQKKFKEKSTTKELYQIHKTTQTLNLNCIRTRRKLFFSLTIYSLPH
jgi:hypothetical protein